MAARQAEAEQKSAAMNAAAETHSQPVLGVFERDECLAQLIAKELRHQREHGHAGQPCG